jgi:hypothetical protein
MSKMSALTDFIIQRMWQTQARLIAIPAYREKPFPSFGRDYTDADILKLLTDMDECQAALDGIKHWKKSVKKKDHPKNKQVK